MRPSITLAVATLIPCACARAGEGLAAKHSPIHVSVDPRVELIGIIFRLAGNPEYCQGRVPAYDADIARHFAQRKGDAAVKLAAQLKASNGVSYDAPMGLAVHLDDATSLQPRVPLAPLPADLDSRWTKPTVEQFLKAARAFAKDADFTGFVTSHEALYARTTERLRKMVDADLRPDWFGRFYGAKASAEFHLVAGLVNGPQCYGVRARVGDVEEIYSILGVWKVDAKGDPVFDSGMAETIAHEFCHSWCNPLADAHEAQLRVAGERIFPHVADQMRNQAYANWRTMMKESLVRASTVRYVQATRGEQAAAQHVDDQVRRGFMWTAELAKLFADYETQRDQYPTLESFFPRVVEFFNTYSVAFDKAMTEWAAKAPRIVSLTPANGATDVDPALAELRVTFDKPMGGRYSFCGGEPTFPEIAAGKKPQWLDEGKTCVLPVKLKRNHGYTIGLNSPQNHGFATRDGVPLKPVVWTFSTRR